ncbi:asparaginase family protein [Burkholderia pseudomallei]|nr:asparaginase family protein [Burkholderia pseudomallei]
MNAPTSSHSPHVSNPAPRALPRIAVLATGGTIAGAAPDAAQTAGYQAGALGVDRLLAAVPALAQIATIEAEQVASIDSKDLSPALWTTLAERIDALAANDAIDGIVITHGTDTLEETAYLLHLTVKTAKPVVMTAAMRPATALSSDGPLNLLNAVAVAGSAAARGQGVLVAFNNRIHSARDVVKTSTYAVDAFHSPELGALGWVQDGRIEFARRATRPHTLDSRFAIGAAWPQVGRARARRRGHGQRLDPCGAAGGARRCGGEGRRDRARVARRLGTRDAQRGGERRCARLRERGFAQSVQGARAADARAGGRRRRRARIAAGVRYVLTESCAPASEAARPADRAACAASERTDARRIEPETRATRKKKADPRARFFLDDAGCARVVQDCGGITSFWPG